MLMPMTNIARVRDFGSREVREECGHGAGHRAEPLHDACGDERAACPPPRPARNRDVQEESDDDERLAPDTVGPDTEGNLHHGLREPVCAHREPGEERRSARQ